MTSHHRSSRLARTKPALVSLLVALAAWELGARWADASFVAPMSDTMKRLADMVVSGEFSQGLLTSLQLFATGLALSIAVGVPVGLLIARHRRVRIAVEWYVTVLYSIPMIALIPFILSMFGFGFWPKVLVVVLFSVFPVLYNTIEGARSIDPCYLDVARAFRSSEWRAWRDILLPYTLPFALAGVRQAIGRALVGVIAAEMFLGASGIGAIISSTSQNFDMPGLLAVVFVVTMLGVCLMSLGEHLERRLVAWRGQRHD